MKIAVLHLAMVAILRRLRSFSQKKIAGQLSLVFCDQPEAYVLTRAQNARFPLFAFRHLIFHLVSNMRNKY